MCACSKITEKSSWYLSLFQVQREDMALVDSRDGSGLATTLPAPKSRIKKKESILSSFVLDALAQNQGLRLKAVAESQPAPQRREGTDCPESIMPFPRQNTQHSSIDESCR